MATQGLEARLHYIFGMLGEPASVSQFMLRSVSL
jgi:hypothetical protein